MGRLSSIVARFTAPSTEIEDPVEAGSARILASCVLLSIAGLVVLDVYLFYVRPDYRPPLVGYALLLASYVLSRTRHHRWAAVLVTAIFILVPLGMVLFDGEEVISLSFLVIAPIFAGSFLGLRAVLVTGAISTALLAYVAISMIERPSVEEVATAASAVFLAAIVAAFHEGHRDWVERTRRRELERHEAQVRHLQKMEAIGRFAGGIAHDFNNMLAVIGASVESLRRKGASPEIELVDSAVRSASSLTQQLLMMSRQELDVEEGETDLPALFDKVGGMLERVIGRDVEVTIVVEPGVQTVAVAPGKLEQILLNLAANSRDAMPRGGEFEICAVSAGDGVALTVRDTGVGMDEATRQRIFEPFYTTKEAGKGTGLGLAMVFGIVTQAGGSVEVESEVGKGATFLLWLPSSAPSKIRRVASSE